MGASAGRGGTGQLPVPSEGPSHCWDGSEWTQGQGRIWRLNQAGRLRLGLWGAASSQQVLCQIGIFQPCIIPATWERLSHFRPPGSAHPKEEARRWLRARTQSGPVLGGSGLPLCHHRVSPIQTQAAFPGIELGWGSRAPAETSSGLSAFSSPCWPQEKHQETATQCHTRHPRVLRGEGPGGLSWKEQPKA